MNGIEEDKNRTPMENLGDCLTKTKGEQMRSRCCMCEFPLSWRLETKGWRVQTYTCATQHET